ncbi:MAG: radical SAM protein [Planctomycetes bacterium]|nr:radical SAM protein [Planctomycetota bacterium]
MVNVVLAERKTAVLTPSSLACLSQIPTVNLTAGCAHGCLYCYTRSYSSYPGEDKVTFYTNTFDKLRDELTRKRRAPKAVYFSPSSDLFQPLPEVLDLGYEILEFLLGRKIGVAFLTKGLIPERHMRLFEENAPLVRAQLGLITLDGAITGVFEPCAPEPAVRLSQAKRLARAGIKTQMRLDPILPGLTDDAESIGRVCGAVAEAGVKHIAASALFLRPSVADSLKRHIRDPSMLDKLLRAFGQGSRMAIHARNSSVFALPVTTRQQMYERVAHEAQLHGLIVHLCACKNPDLASGSCSIAGEWTRNPTAAIQRGLFPDDERS